MKKAPNKPVRLLLTTLEAASLTLIVWGLLKHLLLPTTGLGKLIFLIILTCGTLAILWVQMRNYVLYGFRPRVFFYSATVLLLVLSLIGPGDYAYFPGYTAVYFLLGILCQIGASIACYKASK